MKPVVVAVVFTMLTSSVFAVNPIVGEVRTHTLKGGVIVSKGVSNGIDRQLMIKGFDDALDNTKKSIQAQTINPRNRAINIKTVQDGIIPTQTLSDGSDLHMALVTDFNRVTRIQETRLNIVTSSQDGKELDRLQDLLGNAPINVKGKFNVFEFQVNPKDTLELKQTLLNFADGLNKMSIKGIKRTKGMQRELEKALK